MWAEEPLDSAFLDGLTTEIVYRCNLNEELLHLLDARFSEWKMMAVHYLWEDLF